VRNHVDVGLRLFVAIWPDAAAIQALQATVGPTREAHPDLRWQPPGRWHVTLAFVGEAEPTWAASRLDRLMARPDDLPGAEPLRLAGSGTFGPILWVGVAHGPWLTDLAERAQRTLNVADRRFRAHVTVARVRGRPSEAARTARAAAAPLAAHDGPAWLPTELTLVESRPGPDPAYTVLQRWRLPHSS
jgi:2'-5' RNA ligase